MTKVGARRRVLLVVGSWSPAMLADMQRARMLAAYLPSLGWDVEVLSPRFTEVRSDVIEPESADFFPVGIPIHEVGSWARPLFEAMGSSTHGWRTLGPMRLLGAALLRSGRFDLVYFTTTTFVYFSLGPIWKRLHGVPYVLDFQDPWVKEPVLRSRQSRLRSRLAESLGTRLERRAVVGAAGLVAVSPRYIDALTSRYSADRPGWLMQGRNACIPFGAHEADWAVVSHSARSAPSIGRETIVLRYVGAGGAIMKRSFAVLCGILASLRSQGHPLLSRLRIELVGTTYDWTPGVPKELEQVAEAQGVGDLVDEQPGRVPYRRSLELLLDADGVLILGVDDLGYMPSKLFAHALSGKPLLACLRLGSPAYAQMQATPELGHVVWFDGDRQSAPPEAVEVVTSFLAEAAAGRRFDRAEALQPFVSKRMTQRHAELFEACMGASHRI